MRFNSDPKIAAILMGSNDFRTVDLPFAPEYKIAVRLLDDIELDKARMSGQAMFRKYVEKQTWDPVQANDLDPEFLQRLVERSIIIKAFYDPDTVEDDKPVPFFANDAELVRLGSVRVTDLMHLYNEHQDMVNPSRNVDDEEMDRVIEALGKEHMSAESLTGIEPQMLRRYLLSMARRLSDLQKSKSTTTPE